MTTIQFRRGTAAQWATADPVLAQGEPGFETDTGKHKVGDGSSKWSDLPTLLTDELAGDSPKTPSGGDDLVTSEDVRAIRVLTQHEFDSISPAPDVLYVVKG